MENKSEKTKNNEIEKEVKRSLESSKAAITDFFEDNETLHSVLLVSRKKCNMGGGVPMNVINLAKAIRHNPIIRKVVEEALAAANGNYEYLRKFFANKENVAKAIETPYWEEK